MKVLVDAMSDGLTYRDALRIQGDWYDDAGYDLAALSLRDRAGRIPSAAPSSPSGPSGLDGMVHVESWRNHSVQLYKDGTLCGVTSVGPNTKAWPLPAPVRFRAAIVTFNKYGVAVLDEDGNVWARRSGMPASMNLERIPIVDPAVDAALSLDGVVSITVKGEVWFSPYVGESQLAYPAETRLHRVLVSDDGVVTLLGQQLSLDVYQMDDQV